MDVLRRRFIFLFAGLLMSCTSAQKADFGTDENAASRRAHDEVIEMLRARNEGRKPASSPTELAARLTDLNQVRPGRFEVYVFPKVKNQNVKEATANEEILGSPQVFEVSLVAGSPCQTFAKGQLFNNLRPKEVFQVSDVNPNQGCAIIEVTSRKLKSLNKALIYRDDLLQVRLFVDDAYRGHGYDYAIFNDSQNLRTVRTANNLSTPVSSGLTLFPIDLPSAESRVYPGDPGQVISQRLDAVAIGQIQRKFNRNFRIPSCQGAVFDSRDSSGSPVSIGWCRGMPWSHYIENARFIAITQPLSVR